MSFIETKNITKKFGAQKALDDVNMQVEKGELVCILGPSGCGKTTLLRIIAGLENPDGGTLWIDGKDSTMLSPAKRNYGIVFQSYALFPNMTVRQKILFGLQQKKSMSRDEIQVQADAVLRMVDLFEHQKKYPNQLSGGQQQRTALARAIALSPSFLLLDEPLSALDAKVRLKLRAEIRRIQRQLGVTTILVTHDQEEALSMADKIIVMNHSVVEQVGTPREIYEKPASGFVAGFIGTMNFFETGNGRCSIRPENIQLCSHREPYDLTAKVKAIEFRGPLTRITGILYGLEEICIDIPSEHMGELRLHENATIFLRTPAQFLVTYPYRKAAV